MNKIDLACIIDDDPIFVFGLKKIMEVSNFCESILIFKNGEDALSNLSAIINKDEKIPDVILLDLNMPIMDGWQFLDEFVKIEPSQRITIYIVSSSIDPQDINKVQKYKNIRNYIIKPVTLERLTEILKEYSN
ncbi:response regulator [Mesonia maritima]|uniref:CheY-like chemotaxis protein n=1 Tax=Mesonia maritima TaxID=1793873 RepID=A0ABU1K6H9_9FLAO|nr:response regulator [Mesonia maritima]MDR6300906.1 CheY-like chemotaxis protein [Mesonia maritima]